MINDFIKKTNETIVSWTKDEKEKLILDLDKTYTYLDEHPLAFGFTESMLEVAETTMDKLKECINALINSL